MTINFDEEGRPFEVFSTLGKAGGYESAAMEAISRLISLALRSGIDSNDIVDQLKGITSTPAWDQGILVGSPADAVALALERHIPGSIRGQGRKSYATQLQMETAGMPQPKAINGNGVHLPGNASRCPECNGLTIFQEGCQACLSCGWNRCE